MLKSAQNVATSTSNVARCAKAVQMGEVDSQQKLIEASNELSSQKTSFDATLFLILAL